MEVAKKPRTGRPRTVFTDEVLETIPLWIANGADRADIAFALGTTPASLSDACNKRGISLRPVDFGIRRGLGRARWVALRREAERRRISVPQLLADIAIAVVDENLFAGVLGDYDEEE
jgi:hypothetical protein